MIATEDLIRQLAADLTPRRPGMAALRLAIAIVAGAIISLVLASLWLGQPLAAVGYTGIPAFAMKLGFAVSMVIISGILLFSAGRPGQRIGARISWLLVPPFLVTAMAIMEIGITAPQHREAAWLGSSWLTCLLSIAAFSLPVLLGITWAFKRLAPTRLRLAGFLAGITSGSTAAVVYALYCSETTATFLASWYMAGILISGFIGLGIGPRLMRW